MGQEGRERRGEQGAAGVALACAWLRVLNTAPYGRDGKRDNGPEGLLSQSSKAPLSCGWDATSHVLTQAVSSYGARYGECGLGTTAPLWPCECVLVMVWLRQRKKMAPRHSCIPHLGSHITRK